MTPAAPTASNRRAMPWPPGPAPTFVNDWATRLVVGPGRREDVLAQMATLGSRRPLVLCSERFAAGPHLQDILRAGGPVAGVHTQFTRGGSKATDEDVERIADEVRGRGADGVVAIGGGFVMDAAKCAVAALADGALAANQWPARAGEQPGAAAAPAAGSPGGGTAQPHVPHPPLPFLVVPTTAGPGTETTGGASVRNARTNARIRVRDARYTPRVAVLDPELTVSLDEVTTVGTAVNAFAHCVESLYSTATNPLVQDVALAAASLIFAQLERAVDAPHDLSSRSALQVASALAGMATNNSYVCAHHALCHPLSLDAGVPHGTANYVMLRHALRFNLQATEPELARLGTALGVTGDDPAGRSPSAAATVAAVESWLDRFSLPKRLRETGKLSPDDLPHLAAQAFADAPTRFNPRPIGSPEELLALYRAAW